MDVESAHPPPTFSESDEKFKFNEKHSVVEVAEPIHGDVFEDVRDIDLGEDGKERPIGISY
jgi:hypothetical protein